MFVARVAFVAATALLVVASATASASNCSDFAAALTDARQAWCASIYGGDGVPTCRFPARLRPMVHKDWPSQTVYFLRVLELLGDAAPACLAASAPLVRDVSAWLEGPQANASLGGSLLQTWACPSGQPNYFEMPRHLGERIETPWTLGLKCWAFANLVQRWAPANATALAVKLQITVGPSASIANFAARYMSAGALSMRLCRRVMANCFVNASYDPARNGTCPLRVDEFRGGFAWENFLKGSPLTYPF